MKATIVKVSADGGYSAQTENEIAMSFEIVDGKELGVGEAIDIDLPNVLSTRAVVRLRDGARVGIKLRDDDLHDLRVPMQHGGSRKPTAARLEGRS